MVGQSGVACFVSAGVTLASLDEATLASRPRAVGWRGGETKRRIARGREREIKRSEVARKVRKGKKKKDERTLERIERESETQSESPCRVPGRLPERVLLYPRVSGLYPERTQLYVYATICIHSYICIYPEVSRVRFTSSHYNSGVCVRASEMYRTAELLDGEAAGSFVRGPLTTRNSTARLCRGPRTILAFSETSFLPRFEDTRHFF